MFIALACSLWQRLTGTSDDVDTQTKTKWYKCTNRPTAIYIMQSPIRISGRRLTCLYLVAAVFYCTRTLKWHLSQIRFSRSEMFLLLNYRMGHEKVARLPLCTCPCYCINFCIYAMLRTRATFSWPILYYPTDKVGNWTLILFSRGVCLSVC